jgi:hypothetical protein
MGRDEIEDERGSSSSSTYSGDASSPMSWPFLPSIADQNQVIRAQKGGEEFPITVATSTGRHGQIACINASTCIAVLLPLTSSTDTNCFSCLALSPCRRVAVTSLV